MADRPPPLMSRRAAGAAKPPLSYFKHFFASLGDQYVPTVNPNGYVPLVVAQNELTGEAVMQALKERNGHVPTTCAGYDNMKGTEVLRKGIANYLKATFMADVHDDAMEEHIAVSAGAGAVIENLAFLLADAGEGAIIPAPYYPAFDNDLRVRAGVATVPAPEPTFAPKPGTPAPPPTPAALSAAGAAAAQSGTRPRMVIMTNPSNPLGDVVAASDVRDCMAWTLRQPGMHFVSDEIYANSIFDPDNAPAFVSAASLKQSAARDAGISLAEADERVHVVFGFSKDISVSGLRVGCLYTKSTQLLQALDNVCYFCAVPNPVQYSLAALLNDHAWLKHFFAENHRLLKLSRNAASAALDRAGISHTRATAALFLYADFTDVLKRHARTPTPTFADERALFEALFQEARVLVTPGFDCHHPTPGWMRVCFAAVAKEALDEAGRRLKRFVDALDPMPQ